MPARDAGPAEPEPAFACYGDESLACCAFDDGFYVLAFGTLGLRGQVPNFEYLLLDPLLCRSA